MSKRRKVEIVESVQSELVTIHYRSDKIHEMRFVEEYELDVDDLLALHRDLNSIETNHKIFALVFPGRHGGITKEARDIPMSNLEHTAAVAIVAKHLHQRLLGKIYFTVKKDVFVNYKMFRSEESATKWLHAEIAEKAMTAAS